jgi:hypothetical protein
VHEDFVALGGNSLVAMRVLTKARNAGLEITSKDLFGRRTIARLAEVARPRSPIDTEQTTIVGPAPLTPSQYEVLARPSTQQLVLELSSDVDTARLDAALRRVIEHHDALRLCVERGGDGWYQHYTRSATLAEFAAREGRELVLTLDSLIVDEASWRILLGDLRRCYQGAELPKKGSSYRQWAHSLEELAGSTQADEELAYWRDVLRPAPALPTCIHGANTVASARRVRARVAARAQLDGTRSEIEELIHAAVALRVADQFGEYDLLLDVVGDGREHAAAELDLSATIGNFSTGTPLRLTLPGSTDIGTARKTVAQALSAIPRGAGFGALRWLSAHAEECATLPEPQVRVRYVEGLDRDGAVFTPRFPRPVEIHQPDELRQALLDVIVTLAHGEFEVEVEYSANLHTERTVRAFADGIAEILRDA